MCQSPIKVLRAIEADWGSCSVLVGIGVEVTFESYRCRRAAAEIRARFACACRERDGPDDHEPSGLAPALAF